jgi:hypothetical protein
VAQISASGMVWLLVSMVIIGPSFFEAYRGISILGSSVRWDPFNWFPLILFLLMTGLNGPRLLNLWTGSSAKPAGSTGETESRVVPLPSQSWEILPDVLAAENARYFRLIGSVRIASPWFECAYGLYVAQAVAFVMRLVGISETAASK